MNPRLTPVIKKIMKVLKKHGLYIVRIKGDHIIVNGDSPLKRPIILVNEKRLSNAVRLNLLKECEEYGIKREEFGESLKRNFRNNGSIAFFVRTL